MVVGTDCLESKFAGKLVSSSAETMEAATVPSAGACPGKHPQYNWNWALRKPSKRLVPAYLYLGRLGILPANGSRCVQTLRAFRKALEAVPNFAAPRNASCRAARHTVGKPTFHLGMRQVVP